MKRGLENPARENFHYLRGRIFTRAADGAATVDGDANRPIRGKKEKEKEENGPEGP